jgi:hypothetical protein
VKALRRTRRLLSLFLLLALGVLFGSPYLLSTDAGRLQLEDGLSEALGRKVTIASLSIGFLFQSVEAGGVRMSHPEGFPEGDTLAAERLVFDCAWEDLLDGHVNGSVEGDGVVLEILQRGDHTTLDGLGGETQEPAEETTTTLDLKVVLNGCHVLYRDLESGEATEVQNLSVEAHLKDRPDETTGRVRVTAPEFRRDTIVVRDVELIARASDGMVLIDTLRGRLGTQGVVTARGKLDPASDNAWDVRLDAADVDLDRTLLPLVTTVWPFASSAGGQIEGRLVAGLDVAGRGVTWDAIRPTLTGGGDVRLENLSLPPDSLVSQIARLAGSNRDAVTFKDAGARFKVADNWLSFQRLSASGEKVRYDMTGRVSLDGVLDLNFDLLPLARLFGDKTYKDVSKYVDRILVKIDGTTEKPRLHAPDMNKLLQDAGRGALQKELGKLFGDKK